MKSRFNFFASVIIIFTVCFSINAQPKPQKFSIEGSNGEWFVDQERRVTHAKVDNFLGRKSLMVKKGSQVLRSGIEFSEGIIEFDVAPLDESQFIAVIFRRGTFRNYENIYLRPSQSGKYQALQYAPAINASSTWQLYPEFTRAIDLPRNKWTHVKIEVQNGGLKVFINKSEKPILEVARMRGTLKKGTVGFWSRVSDRKSESWSAAFSNVSIKPTTAPSNAITKRQKPKEGVIDSWKVAEPLEKKEGAVMNLPKLKGWKKVWAEESGLVNLNRALGAKRGRWTGFAKTNIKSNKAKRVLLNFGYSDDVTIFLNGKPVFAGINGWESRYPEYMGFVKLGNDSIFLNLKKGNNELVFAVTNQRFGWGLVAQIKDMK